MALRVGLQWCLWRFPCLIGFVKCDLVLLKALQIKWKALLAKDSNSEGTDGTMESCRYECTPAALQDFVSCALKADLSSDVLSFRLVLSGLCGGGGINPP